MTAINTDVKQVERMFNVNVFGPMRMLARFHLSLVNGKGIVINIGSVGGVVPFNYGCKKQSLSRLGLHVTDYTVASYNATKAALVHWVALPVSNWLL
jgi:1-acylglycerone phosphate reductase